MNARRTIVLLAMLVAAISVATVSTEADADRAFSAEVSYFDGFAIVQGTVPDAYANEQSHVEIDIYDAKSERLATAFAEPTSEGVFKQLVKVPLSEGQYRVSLSLLGTGNHTIRLEKDLTIDDSTVVEVSSISLSPSSKELTVGSTLTLVCTINPVTASNQYITWTSSNSSVASVDENGKVTAKSAGTAVITATSIGGKEATSTIAVKDSSSGGSAGSSLSISAGSYILYAGGESATLTATYPSNLGSDSLRWSISPSGYASFTESSTAGKATVHLEGKAVGTVTVTLSSVADGSSTSARFSIVEKPVSGYSFFLRMDLDYDKADYGTSGLTAEDLKKGITLTSTGANAGVALESALKANGIPCSFWSGGDILYWVDGIFGLGDYKYSNGDWKYWIQYHDGTYNSWTLGHYTDGGSFELIYGITNEDGQVVKPTDPTEPDNPPTPVGPTPDQPVVPDTPSEHLDPTDPGVTVENETVENNDGTTTEIQTISKTEDDGTVVTTVISTTEQTDGTVEEIKSTSHTQTSEAGVMTASSIDTVTVKDSKGNVVSETDIEVSIVDTTDSSGTGPKGVTITATDKDGNASVTAEYKDGTGSATVVTEVKATEENGRTVVTDEALDTALMMQEMYADRIVGGSESVKEADKVIQIGSGASDADVVLSSEAMERIAETGSAILVSGSAGSMELSKEVVSNISEDDDVAIIMYGAEDSDLNEAQKGAAENGSVVVVRVMSGGESIGDKLGGEIAISIKHDAAPGKTPVAYYIPENGDRERLDGTYDAENGVMVVRTTHCSIYAVIDEEPAVEPIDDDGKSDGNIMLYIGAAAVAVVLIAIAAVLISRRS